MHDHRVMRKHFGLPRRRAPAVRVGLQAEQQRTGDDSFERSPKLVNRALLKTPLPFLFDRRGSLIISLADNAAFSCKQDQLYPAMRYFRSNDSVAFLLEKTQPCGDGLL